MARAAAKRRSRPRLERRSGSAGERSRAASRRRLLAAGRRLFVRHGVAGVNSNEIARAAGVATGTFYLHYPNKHELFRAIARDLLEDLRAAGDSAIAQSDGRVESVVRIRAEVLLSFCQTNRRLIQLIFGPDGVAAGVLQSLLDDILALFRSRVGRGSGAHRGATGPSDELAAELAAQATAAMWVRTATWWCDHLDAASREDTVETLVRLTLAGADPVRLERAADRA